MRQFILCCGKFTTLPIINQNDMKQLRIPVPNNKEQVIILKYIDDQTQSLSLAITRAEQEIALIQEYRDRLISDVVTGKIDVRGIDVPDVEEAPITDECAIDDADEMNEMEIEENE